MARYFKDKAFDTLASGSLSLATAPGKFHGLGLVHSLKT
jgi:hypothetical protein